MAKHVCVCVYRSYRDFPAKKPHHIILTSPGHRHPHTTCTRDLIHQDSRQNTPAADCSLSLCQSLSVYIIGTYLPTYTFIITCFFILYVCVCVCMFFFLNALCSRTSIVTRRSRYYTYILLYYYNIKYICVCECKN